MHKTLGFKMAFKFKVDEVRYEVIGTEEVTILSGYVIDGAINEPEPVIVPTDGDINSKFSMSSMHVHGGEMQPLKAN